MKYSGGFARQFDSCSSAKAKTSNVFMHHGITHAQSQLDGSNVARLGQRFRKSQRSEWQVIANYSFGHGD
jgi:hypothetical protein